MYRFFARVFVPALILMLALSPLMGAGSRAQAQERTVPNVSDLKVPNSLKNASSSDGPSGVQRPIVDRSLQGRTGRINVVVQLKTESLAEKITSYNATHTDDFSDDQQRSYIPTISTSQSSFVNRARDLGGSPLAYIRKALNAVVLRVDASQINALAALPNVKSVRPVMDYELDLYEVPQYIGATAVGTTTTGYRGQGVTVAVIDSGIDYTHQDLGGPGTTEAYNAAYGTTPPSGTADAQEPKERNGLFPTEKVIEGFDFVGEQWPAGPRTEDPDPIDYEGHGTHVSDIIAGVGAPRSSDGTATTNNSRGIAPGAKLIGVKVCSSISSSCNGVSLLKAADYVLDVNGDGDVDSGTDTYKVDVVNLSLGSSYGQKEDDLSQALRAVVGQGRVVVASAGNSGNRPYIVGSPSSAPEIISVAQTQVPSARAFPLNINEPPSIAGVYNNTATVDFAPIVGNSPQDPNDPDRNGWANQETVYMGRACPGDPIVENPAGKVAVVRRGACAISLKVEQAAEQGAIGVLVALSAPGDAVSFSYGGSDDGEFDSAPTLVITMDAGDKIQAARANGQTVRTTVNSETSVALVKSVVGSSSRGPSFSYNEIKPDIGAPGASVSAIAGTGTFEEAFGGTSGAAPVISGSAALVLSRYPTRTPAEVKAVLMNTAETDIKTNPATSDALAPITRIGGGEVRVDRAVNSVTRAFDADAPAKGGSLSFRYRAVATNTTLTKTVRVQNYGVVSRTYTITSGLRYQDDRDTNAVRITTPQTVTVPARGTADFPVTLSITARNLHEWRVNGGVFGGDAGAFGTPEYDGYINLTAGPAYTNAHVAFQVLPHKAAAQTLNRTSTFTRQNVSEAVKVSNPGATNGRVEPFTLVGSSPPKVWATLPEPGDNRAASVDLRRAGARTVITGGTATAPEYGVQFGVFTAGYRAHPNYPAEFDIYIDTDRLAATNSCGSFGAEYIVYNSELGGFGATGQNVVNLYDCTAGTSTPMFYTDADLNSNQAILTVALNQLKLGGVAAARTLNENDQFDFEVILFDNYFTGAFEDAIGTDTNDDGEVDVIKTMSFTPARPRYQAALVESGDVEEGVPVDGTETLRIQKVGTEADTTSEGGLLLFFRDPRFGKEGAIVLVDPGTGT